MTKTPVLSKLTFNRDETDLEEKGGRLIVTDEAGNIMDYVYVLEECGKALVEFVEWRKGFTEDCHSCQVIWEA